MNQIPSKAFKHRCFQRVTRRIVAGQRHSGLYWFEAYWEQDSVPASWSLLTCVTAQAMNGPCHNAQIFAHLYLFICWPELINNLINSYWRNSIIPVSSDLVRGVHMQGHYVTAQDTLTHSVQGRQMVKYWRLSIISAAPASQTGRMRPDTITCVRSDFY